MNKVVASVWSITVCVRPLLFITLPALPFRQGRCQTDLPDRINAFYAKALISQRRIGSRSFNSTTDDMVEDFANRSGPFRIFVYNPFKSNGEGRNAHRVSVLVHFDAIRGTQ